MSDLRPLSASVSKLTSLTFSKKFVALGRVLNNWNDIIGPDMSVKAQPVKIHYRKPKDKGDKPQATLDIAATSSDATLLHYQKDIIIARLNQLFGDNWITAIRFVHIVANSPSSSAQILKPIPQENLQQIDDFLSSVTDDDIRASLQKLGRGVLKKSRVLES